MSNTFLTPSIIAKEAAMVLENNLVAGSLVYKDYSSEFAQVGDTITVRKPATFTAKDFTDTIDVQNATENGITLKLDKFKDISFGVTAKDLALNLNDFSAQLLQPAMRAMNQQIDADVLSVSNEFTPYYQRGSTIALADFAQVGKVMNINKAPMSDRYSILNATHYADYVALDGIIRNDASGSTDGLRNAMLGRVLGFDTYLDQNMIDTPVNAITTGNATVVKDEMFMTVATASAGVPVGALFTIAGDTTVYCVTGVIAADKKILIDKPATKTIGTAAALTFVGAKNSSLCFHKNAIALVSAPLKSLSNNNVATETVNGITVRVSMGYDMTTKKDIISVDCLYGVGVIDKNLGARLISA